MVYAEGYLFFITGYIPEGVRMDKYDATTGAYVRSYPVNEFGNMAFYPTLGHDGYIYIPGGYWPGGVVRYTTSGTALGWKVQESGLQSRHVRFSQDKKEIYLVDGRYQVGVKAYHATNGSFIRCDRLPQSMRDRIIGTSILVAIRSPGWTRLR